VCCGGCGTLYNGSILYSEESYRACVLSTIGCNSNFLQLVSRRERPKRRWVDNIRMDLQEVGCGYMDWIGLAQERDR